MKIHLAKTNSILLIVSLAVFAISCGVRTMPKATTAVPTLAPTVDIFATLAVTGDSPPGGGDPVDSAQMEPPADLLPPPATTELAPLLPAPVLPCENQAGCSRMGITQSGQVSQVEWSGQDVRQLASPAILPQEQSRDNHWIVDTGQPSPDGTWVAFTSLSYESGGPVFLQNQESGEWTNVISTVNILLPEGRQRLVENYMWDVIGWFPDSQYLMIGPYDLSFVAIVELSTFSVRVIPFPGAGMGGRAHVDLADDGSHFIYVGENASGAQTLSAYNLATGDSTVLQVLPYAQGILSNPRLSPDSKSLAYLRLQNGSSIGTNDEIQLLSLETGTVTALAKGTLRMAVPTWSPDGQSLAFTLLEQDKTAIASKDTARGAVRGNVWTVAAAGGEPKQITNIDGLARSPAWSPDGKTLAFVTHDGQVGVASVERPGQIWQAAGPSPLAPELTSVYFLP